MAPKWPEIRIVNIGDHAKTSKAHRYCDNEIDSSKYTPMNFIPKNLFEQFRRIANFYFLLVATVQLSLPETPVNPIVSVLPLTFVITVTAVKQGYEDWRRHKADYEVNYCPVSVVRNGELKSLYSKDIEVGDIVKIDVNESFPCDLILLSTENEEGLCYITTANLDGETNLKIIQSVNETKGMHDPAHLSKIDAIIECQQPIEDLYKFVGRVDVHAERGTITHPLSAENILLRGARLRNTLFIYGCAVHTGLDTKLALNSKQKQSKLSRVEKSMNFYLVLFFVILVSLATISTCGKYSFLSSVKLPWYLHSLMSKKVTGGGIILDFLSYLVLYNYIIPISLYVTVELQKFIGATFFEWDLQMYDEETDSPAIANTSDLNEELGQIEFLFSDKTGTLTENLMEFRKCSIDGIRYEDQNGQLFRVVGNDLERITTYSTEVMDFFLTLCLCHNVQVHLPEGQPLPNPDPFIYEYQASSPDEKAFLDACRRYGFIFHGVKNKWAMVSLQGKMVYYKILHTLEFDSTRKRMSVIVESEQGEAMLCVKGAENTMLANAVEGCKESIIKDVDDYALVGLRTLVIGLKRFTAKEHAEVEALLHDAKTSLEDRETKTADALEKVERGYIILGSTAIEDKLQDNVAQTIESLRKGGIKVWVLTGDKVETAINISHSTGHFHESMIMHKVTKSHDPVALKETLETIYKEVSGGGIRRGGPVVISHSFVIDGPSLGICMQGNKELLCNIGLLCDAVLCCRMSPLQKALVVQMIKHSKAHPVTAAVGDGANDVSMIQEAHVGLGIMGKEGRQAVRNSDYAFAKFCYLHRAILVHGHYFYIRIATLVQYFFYKNVIFVLPSFLYQSSSAYSQLPLFEAFYLMMYNIAFTSWPILIFGVFEKHRPDASLFGEPHLYKRIAKNSRLSWSQFILWSIEGVWHAFVVYHGTKYLFRTFITDTAESMGYVSFGSIVYFQVVLIANMKLWLETHCWNSPMFLVYIVTFGLFFGTSSLYASAGIKKRTYWAFFKIMEFNSIWLIVFIQIFFALLPDLVVRAFRDERDFVVRGNRVGPQKKLDAEKCDQPPSQRKVSVIGGKVMPQEEPDVAAEEHEEPPSQRQRKVSVIGGIVMPQEEPDDAAEEHEGAPSQRKVSVIGGKFMPQEEPDDAAEEQDEAPSQRKVSVIGEIVMPQEEPDDAAEESPSQRKVSVIGEIVMPQEEPDDAAEEQDEAPSQPTDSAENLDAAE